MVQIWEIDRLDFQFANCHVTHGMYVHCQSKHRLGLGCGGLRAPNPLKEHEYMDGEEKPEKSFAHLFPIFNLNSLPVEKTFWCLC